MDCLSKFKAACCPQNMCKNRYYNVLPNEDSRVKLHALAEGDSDYINANFVGCEKVRRKYILTQAPLPNTMNDLWRMVWQEKVPVIVCLTKLSEGEVQKAHKYWPEEGQTMQFGRLFVKQTRSQLVSNIAVRYFDVWLEGDWTKEKAMQVTHMHYLDWPDHGTPASTQPIRTLASMVSDLSMGSDLNMVSDRARPVVVHCSAGVGRAGTFVAIHMTLDLLELSQSSSKVSISIKDMVSTLRSQREGTVQTVDQYVFIYKVIADSILSSKRHSLILALQNSSSSSISTTTTTTTTSSSSSSSSSSPASLFFYGHINSPLY
jgi:protein tyrosine phosphatase